MSYHPSEESRRRFGELRFQSLRDAVYDSLREEIIASHFSPGTALGVEETATALEVGSQPVRAAFSRLIAEGSALPNGTAGVRIPVLQPMELQQLAEVRLLLEGEAAGLAALRISSEDIDELSRISVEIERAAAAERTDYLRLHRAFKFQLYSAARQPVLNDAIQRLWLRVAPPMNSYLEALSERPESTQNTTLLDALRSRNAEAACGALHREIREGLAVMLART